MIMLLQLLIVQLVLVNLVVQILTIKNMILQLFVTTEGDSCRNCTKPIQRIVQSGRSSFFCSACQR